MAQTFVENDQLQFGDLNAIDGAAALTVAMWVLPSATSQLGMLLGKVETVGASANDIQFVHSTNAGSASGDGLCVITGTSSPRGGVGGLWTDTTTPHHVAFVFDGGGVANGDRLKIYFDAVSQTLTFNGTIPATLGSSTNGVYMGTAGDTSRDYSGNVGHLKVWTAALSATQIAQEMRYTRPVTTGNLLIWCPFEDTRNDLSGNGNHANILVGTPGLISYQFPVIPGLGGGPSLVL